MSDVEPVDYILKFHSDFYNPIKNNIKKSTIRADSKPLNIDDVCIAYFQPVEDAILLHIHDHYAKRFKDISQVEAEREGYYHPDLLRNSLKNIYPDLVDDDYIYFYRFTRLKGHQNIIDEFLKNNK